MFNLIGSEPCMWYSGAMRHGSHASAQHFLKQLKQYRNFFLKKKAIVFDEHYWRSFDQKRILFVCMRGWGFC